MILISHRGNTNGKFESWENEPTYIDQAINNGYDVEVDVWYKDNVLWLGHDKPEYGGDFRWFRDRATKLWIHCKNVEALLFLKSLPYTFNYFWHENDIATLTSHGHIWTYPTNKNITGTIAVLPERFVDTDLTGCVGVCSDYIAKYNDKTNYI